MAEKPKPKPETLGNAHAIVCRIVEQTGGKITLALPLGLGKANTIVNALVQAAINDASIRLEIFTALTLEKPVARSELERRFLEPAMDRLFGRYPPLLYSELLRKRTLPDNIHISEFFLLAGRWLNVAQVQQDYICANYTDALHYLVARKPNVVTQLLARNGNGALNLSCNTDITADLIKMRHEGTANFILAGEVNSSLPFMAGPAADVSGEVDLLLDDPDTDFELFSVAKQPVDLSEQAIGLHVCELVRDGGTLQIGIGSIGDAVAQAMIIRHQQNGVFREVIDRSPFPTSDGVQEHAPFEIGLYAVTEMLVDGLLQLFAAGIVRREVAGAAIHAGFFVESRAFYESLRTLPPVQRAKIVMMPVSFTNLLYGDEAAKRRARVDARFVNNAMMATLLGAVVSDGTGDGQVVSGVGGQFDFVAQAFALSDARSVITLNATRHANGKLVSNIVWNYPHTTIPRHLKDLVVTEYGIADLRGKSDQETIASMLTIADSRFQDGLLAKAKEAGKIANDYQIPARHRNNMPGQVHEWLMPFRANDLLPEFPFGTDFTDDEQRLLPALRVLKQSASSKWAFAKLAWEGILSRPSPEDSACLERMDLTTPVSVTERVYAILLRGAMFRVGQQK